MRSMIFSFLLGAVASACSVTPTASDPPVSQEAELAGRCSGPPVTAATASRWFVDGDRRKYDDGVTRVYATETLKIESRTCVEATEVCGEWKEDPTRSLSGNFGGFEFSLGMDDDGLHFGLIHADGWNAGTCLAFTRCSAVDATSVVCPDLRFASATFSYSAAGQYQGYHCGQPVTEPLAFKGRVTESGCFEMSATTSEVDAGARTEIRYSFWGKWQ